MSPQNAGPSTRGRGLCSGGEVKAGEPFEGSTVFAAGCPRYEPGPVREALERSFAAHGFLPPGSPATRVLVKPNLLRPAHSGRAVTTHPAVLVETVRILRERGHEVSVGDSPGVGNARANLAVMGCLREIEATGARVCRLGHPVRVLLPGGRVLPVSRTVLEAEVLLNLPKWKTHVQVGLTGAVKNLFGCVPGPRKALQHIAYGHREREFVAMLVGLAAFLRPSLTVVDGIVAMEGDGPGGGAPKPVGFLFSGKDPISLDRVLATLMGFPDLGLFQVAKDLGIGESDPARIPVAGDPLPDPIEPPFRLPAPRPLTFHPVRRALDLLRRQKRGFLLDL